MTSLMVRAAPNRRRQAGSDTGGIDGLGKRTRFARSGDGGHGAEQAATAEGFGALHHAAMAAGALTAKEKELIALAIGISKQCVGCIGFHVRACIAAGATRDEIAETVNVCILMGGGPGYVYALKALEAYDQLSA